MLDLRGLEYRNSSVGLEVRAKCWGQLVPQQETSLNSICDMSFNLHRNNMMEEEEEDEEDQQPEQQVKKNNCSVDEVQLLFNRLK